MLGIGRADGSSTRPSASRPSMTRLMHFYAHESCGKCTPCREGTSWLVKIHDRIMAGGGRMEDLDILLRCLQQHHRRHAPFCPAWPEAGGLADRPVSRWLKRWRAMRFILPRTKYEAADSAKGEACGRSGIFTAALPMAGCRLLRQASLRTYG